MSIYTFTGPGDKCDHIPSRFTKRTGYVKILLLGLPCSGKTSLFNLLTSNEQNHSTNSSLFSTADVNMRVCFPMDARLEWMNRNFRCTDKIPLKVNVIDTPSIVAGSIRGKGLGLGFLTKVKAADVIYLVLRGFASPSVSSYDEKIDVVQDLQTVNQELMLYDLQTCESAIASMEPIFKLKQEGRDARFEYDALFKVWHILTGFSRPNYMAPELKPKQLEAIQTGDISLPGKCKGKPLRFAADLFDDQDIELLRKYEFFTAKETVYLVNMSPREYLRADCLHVDALMSHLATRHRREYSMQRTSGVVTAIKSCPVKLPTEKPLPPVPPPGSAGKTPQKQGSFYTKELPKELQLSPNSDNDQTAPDANAFVYSVTNYYDNAVVVPFSIPFEYSLHSSIVGTEGPAALEEYFQANPRHISLKQSLLQEVAHSALGLWVFYTLELIDPEASTLGSGGDTATVQTGLSGAQFNTEFGLIRAFTVLDGTCAPAAAGYVDKDIERGFISAQVANYDELVEAHGDLNLLKREKKIRQQGKKYAINGGDIISFDYYTPLQLAEQAQSLAGSSGAAK